MNAWAWTGLGCAGLFVVLVVWPVLVAGRRNDKANGRLEEQQ